MSQLTKNQTTRLMYLENKDGDIDGHDSRIGWVTFSKTGSTIYYRGRSFQSLKGSGISGNYFDIETDEEYWISGIKKNGDNSHPCESVSLHIDSDALEEYRKTKEK